VQRHLDVPVRRPAVAHTGFSFMAMPDQ
jgi:hypothetical protein